MKNVDWCEFYTIEYSYKHGGCLLFNNGESIRFINNFNYCEEEFVRFSEIEKSFFTKNFVGEPQIELLKKRGLRINGYFIEIAYCYTNDNIDSDFDLEMILSWKTGIIDINHCVNFVKVSDYYFFHDIESG